MRCPQVSALRDAWAASRDEAPRAAGAAPVEEHRRLFREVMGEPRDGASFRAALQFVGGAMARRRTVLRYNTAP